MKNMATGRIAAAAALSACLAAGGVAMAAGSAQHTASSATRAVAAESRQDGVLAQAFDAVDRNTAWQLTGKLKLNFATYHTEGMVQAEGHIFLSAVQIIEPTQKYPTPQGGYDRTPGRGIGHVFVMDGEGHLLRDIVLGEGDMYHPGGIDSDGSSVWVPVAQYRPNSSSIIYRIDLKTLEVHKEFEVKDHIGGIVRDEVTGHLIGNTWGSRHFYEWNEQGRQIADWNNSEHFIDYQDCQYVPDRKMLCGGVTNLPQTPAAGGTGAVYELGGMALIDLRNHRAVHEVPFQQWSTVGHVVTRNPLKLAVDGDKITMWAAPDNGEEGNGTEILTYQASVHPAG